MLLNEQESTLETRLNSKKHTSVILHSIAGAIVLLGCQGGLRGFSGIVLVIWLLGGC